MGISRKGFSGEKVRVRTINRLTESRLEARREDWRPPYRGAQRAHSVGSDHPQEQVSSLEDGILDDTVCVRAHARACVCAHACARMSRGRGEKGEQEEEEEKEGKEKKRRHYSPLKKICSLLKPLQ